MTNAAVSDWMTSHYSNFRDYALKKLPGHIREDHREDVVQDMMVKMLSCDSFEEYLSKGKKYSYSTILLFAVRKYRNMTHVRGGDCLGRHQQCRTRSEIENKKEVVVTHPSPIQAVRTSGEEGSEKEFSWDFRDDSNTFPSPLEQMEVNELLETLVRGVQVEWEGEPFEIRQRVFELMLEEGSRKDIEDAVGVKSTRAKVLRTEVREVARHWIDIKNRNADKQLIEGRQFARPILGKKRNRTGTALKIQSLLPDRGVQVDTKLTTKEVPQFDRLLYVFPRLRQLMGEAVEFEIALSTRHIQYLDHSMKILGLLDSKGEVTDLGKETIAQGLPQKDVLKALIEESTVGKVWMLHTGISDFTKIPVDTITSMLQRRSNLSASTAKRRARTLKRWVNFFSIGQ
tara:strand:+ start:5472 stop:6671 length:1200 start_codon:yes stop_codon:yes gene_type:complete